MDLFNVSGSYGFIGRFFQYAWDVIGVDVGARVQFFFSYSQIQPGLDFNFILLPKIENDEVIESYRPIVLGNFLLKLSPRLSLLLLVHY